MIRHFFAAKKVAAVIEPAVPHLQPESVLAAVGSIANSASKIGQGAAELDGVMADATRVGLEQVAKVASLTHDVKRMEQGNRDIDAKAHGGREAVESTRQAVEGVAQGVLSVMASLRSVAEAASQITRIALQTRLVAFNATVEAKRAGEAGAGFAVVADAVKALAGQVEASSKQITDTIATLDADIVVLAASIVPNQTGNLGKSGAVSPFQEALARVEHAVTDMATVAQHNLAQCVTLIEVSDQISTEVRLSAEALNQAQAHTRNFLSASETLIELSNDCGARTADTPFIEAVLAASEDMAHCLESAIDRGDISLQDLFDTQYAPIPGTAPQQFTTRYIDLTDRLFPPIQERLLELDPRIVFCAAVDNNGFLPTHNKKFSLPQRSDAVWNAAHCRNRRVFNDKTGLSAGRNLRRFLLQTYRRDMGGGHWVVMKDLSAPITVKGQHWGGLRLAYAF